MVTVFTNGRYLEARFHIYLKILTHLDYGEFENVVVHELLHMKNSLIEVWKDDVLDHVSKSSRAGWKRYYKTVDENFTEQMAIVLLALEKKSRKGKK